MADSMVPIALPITFSKVCEVVNQDLAGTNGRHLMGAGGQFAIATGTFDPTYVGDKDRLSNFRGYNIGGFEVLNELGPTVSYTVPDGPTFSGAVLCFSNNGDTLIFVNYYMELFLFECVGLPYDYTNVLFKGSILLPSSKERVTGIRLHPNGTSIYIVIDGSTNIMEKRDFGSDVTTTFDISSTTLSQSKTLSSENPVGLEFNLDGSKFWHTDYDSNIYEYSMTSNWNINTASFVTSYSTGLSNVGRSISFVRNGYGVIINEQFSSSTNSVRLTQWDLSSPYLLSSMTNKRSGSWGIKGYSTFVPPGSKNCIFHHTSPTTTFSY